MLDFISLLRCPISGLPIRKLDNSEVVKLNQKIDRRDIPHFVLVGVNESNFKLDLQ